MRNSVAWAFLASFCSLAASVEALAQGVTRNAQSRAPVNAFSDLRRFVSPVPDDAKALTWRLAELMSFKYASPDGNAPFPPPERLYLPWRRLRFTLNPAAGYVDAARAIQSQFDRIAKTQHEDVATAAREARSLYLERYKIGAFNQAYGNTPDSSFADLAEYLGSRIRALAELERAIDRDKAEGGENAPMSESSAGKLLEFVRAMDGRTLESIVADGARLSGWLAYADMNRLDQQAKYWQTVLLPLIKQDSGPATDTELVELEAVWRPKGGIEQFSVLTTYAIRNTSKERLNRVVVELLAENQWGEKAGQYYAIRTLAPGEVYYLRPHFRWERRRLDFTNSINISFSVWTESASNLGKNVHLTNPKPNPDSEGWRRDFLRFDNQEAATGELWGLLATATFPSPVPNGAGAVSTPNLAAEGAGNGKVVAPEQDPDSAERKAAAKLRLAKNLIPTNKDAAARYLKDIQREFPATKAALEAADLLKSL